MTLILRYEKTIQGSVSTRRMVSIVGVAFYVNKVPSFTIRKDMVSVVVSCAAKLVGHDSCISAAKHCTYTNAQSVHSACFHTNLKTKELKRYDMIEMPAWKATYPALTKQTAPMVFASKPKRTFCFWANYRHLTFAVKHNECSVARMNECIDFFHEATIFSALDARKGQCQLKL